MTHSRRATDIGRPQDGYREVVWREAAEFYEAEALSRTGAVKALHEVISLLQVERMDDGSIGCISYDSDALPKIVAILDAALEPADSDFHQPQRKDGDKPCGECRLKPDEICDICGAIEPAAPNLNEYNENVEPRRPGMIEPAAPES